MKYSIISGNWKIVYYLFLDLGVWGWMLWGTWNSCFWIACSWLCCCCNCWLWNLLKLEVEVSCTKWGGQMEDEVVGTKWFCCCPMYLAIWGGELGLIPWPLVVVVMVGVKDVNNWFRPWSSLVIGCTTLGKENASYSNSTLKLEVEMEDGIIFVVVNEFSVVFVLVADWQLRTMANKSQSSAIVINANEWDIMNITTIFWGVWFFFCLLKQHTNKEQKILEKVRKIDQGEKVALTFGG